MHEHVFALDTDVVRNYPEDWATKTFGWPTR
jgi:hypothetical protein